MTTDPTLANPSGAPVIGLVAGEDSGDSLGASLVERLRQNYPKGRFVGIGGERMRAAGVETWWDTQELAVMGLFEVARDLPRLFGLRRELRARLLACRPDLFIGIDAPDFNLGLEIQLRRAGIRTLHYVSPTVWAWRSGRVRKIARAADRVLCLFPFEPDFLQTHGIAATYVGHPMADQIPIGDDPEADRQRARAALGLPAAASIVALLPGSRMGEVGLLAGPMLHAAEVLRAQRPGIAFVAAMANEAVAARFRQAMQDGGVSGVEPVQGRTREVIAAASVVLCASGTATLETMLINRPLVMAYRLARSTYLAARYLRIIRRQLFALPNILAGEELVPELIQDEASGERLAVEAARWLDDPDARARLQSRFSALHRELRCDAAGRAAEAVTEMLASGRE